MRQIVSIGIDSAVDVCLDVRMTTDTKVTISASDLNALLSAVQRASSCTFVALDDARKGNYCATHSAQIAMAAALHAETLLDQIVLDAHE